MANQILLWRGLNQLIKFEYVLFEKMRLPNIQKTRFCRQNWEIHGNLGGQEPGTKKQFEYVLFEKMRLPNFRKGLEAEAGRQAEVGMAVFFLLDFCGPGFLMVFQFYLQISGF
jgi:hypothetical protein